MKIEGYVICQPVNTWGNSDVCPWHPETSTFGHTPLESWIRFLMAMHKIDYRHNRWYEMQNHYVNRGYCPKKASMEIDI